MFQVEGVVNQKGEVGLDCHNAKEWYIIIWKRTPAVRGGGLKFK